MADFPPTPPLAKAMMDDPRILAKAMADGRIIKGLSMKNALFCRLLAEASVAAERQINDLMENGTVDPATLRKGWNFREGDDG